MALSELSTPEPRVTATCVAGAVPSIQTATVLLTRRVAGGVLRPVRQHVLAVASRPARARRRAPSPLLSPVSITGVAGTIVDSLDRDRRVAAVPAVVADGAAALVTEAEASPARLRVRRAPRSTQLSAIDGSK